MALQDAPHLDAALSAVRQPLVTILRHTESHTLGATITC